MTNIEIVAIILIAVGFGFIITRLGKLLDICSLIVTLLINKDSVQFKIFEEDE